MTAVNVPHHKISYAQNFEDLVIAGFLKKVTQGYYVDVGANHPTHDSVTRIFYDKGWRGINIEPNPALHELLQQQRPLDTNLRLGVAARTGAMRFRRYTAVDGLSTFRSEVFAGSAADQPNFVDDECEVDTLANILARHRPDGDIHFLKVDVEGLELEVLLGNDWRRFRPWLICLERNQDAARQQTIAAFLTAVGYLTAFYDGVNDFYVARTHGSLQQEFSYAGDVILDGMPVRFEFVPQPVDDPQQALLALEAGSFIEGAYKTVLGRLPDIGGLAHYSSALASGVSKEEVLLALADSEEARRRGPIADWIEALRPTVPARATPPPMTRLRRWLARQVRGRPAAS